MVTPTHKNKWATPTLQLSQDAGKWGTSTRVPSEPKPPISQEVQLPARTEPTGVELQRLFIDAFLPVTEKNAPTVVSYLQDNPKALRATFIGEGRNDKTETLAWQLYPDITEQGMADLFNPAALVVEQKAQEMAERDGGGVLGTFTSGVGDLVRSLVSAPLKWMGHEELGQRVGTFAEYMQVQAAPVPFEPQDFSAKQLVNPEFYKTYGVRMLPILMGFVAVAIGGLAVGAAATGGFAVGITTKLGLGVKGAFIVKHALAAIVAGGLSRPIESTMEGGMAYEEARAKGYTHEEADRVADEVFNKNMRLVGLDALQIGVAFAPTGVVGGAIRGLAARGLIKATQVGGKLLIEGLTEGGEELYQEMVTKQALGEPIDWTSPEMQLVFSLGAIAGIGFGAGGDIMTNISNRGKGMLTKEQLVLYEKKKAELVGQGIDENVASLEALGEVVVAYPELSSEIGEMARQAENEYLANIPEAKEIVEGQTLDMATTVATTGQAFTATVYRGATEIPTDEGLVGKGQYHTTDPAYAATYGTVTQSTVKLSNPFVINTQSEWDALGYRTRALRDTALEEGRSEDWVQESLRGQLEAEGHDGVVIAEGIVERGKQIVVFHPEESITEYAPTTAMAEGETFTGEPGVTPEAVKPIDVTPEPPTPITSIIQKLTDAIRFATPARVETELLKTAERAKRIPGMRKAALAAKPEEAAFAAMGRLKGELPKAQFTPPETVLTPGDVSALYGYVRNRLLIDGEDAFKWLNTDAALRKLLAGEIPTRGELSLLEDVFGPDLVEVILAKRPLSEKVWENLLDVLNIPRSILASCDLSAWLRQGAFVVTSQPKIGARALAVDFKTLFSGKYTKEIDQFIRTTKYAPLREKAKLYLAPVEGTAATKLSQREEMFISRLVKKIPIIGPMVKWSERAYVSTLNYMRAMTFDRYAAMWEGQGYSPETYRQLATLINWATGRGPIGKLANMTPVLNALFFATRLQTSRAAMLFGGYKFTSPPVRKAYARMMLSFFGTMGGIVALGALAGLWDTDKDPRSSDFGKIRIGNTRLDPWAGFLPIARLITHLVTGERKTATGRIQDIGRMETLERFMRSKASPAFGLAWDMIEGETFLGEALSLEAEGVGEQVYQRLTPLFIQDLIDSIKEEGWVGGFVALPGAFGVGIVSYPGSIDAYERHVQEIPEDMLLDWQKGIQTGGGQLTYMNLNSLQRAWLRRHCEAIGDVPERIESGSYNFYEAQSKTYEEFDVLLNEEMQPVTEGYSTGQISLSDYIEQSEYLRNKYFGRASTLWLDAMRQKLDPLLHKNLERWHEEEIKPEDAAYEQYMELRANPPRVSGVPDWDAWDKALSDFMDTQSKEVKDYIEQRRIDWINNLSPDRQSIEKLVLDCESILDDYYAVDSKKRYEYRDRHPEVDARLIILRDLNPRTGLQQARALLKQYGISTAYLETQTRQESKWGISEEAEDTSGHVNKWGG